MGSKELTKLDTNSSRITCMCTSRYEKIVVVGYSDSTIEFWKYYEKSQDIKLIKEIKEDFQLFEIDTLCSSMLILNPKGRDIGFYLIEWEWNTDAINEDLQKINLDFENIKAEDLEVSLLYPTFPCLFRGLCACSELLELGCDSVHSFVF